MVYTQTFHEKARRRRAASGRNPRRAPRPAPCGKPRREGLRMEHQRENNNQTQPAVASGEINSLAAFGSGAVAPCFPVGLVRSWSPSPTTGIPRVFCRFRGIGPMGLIGLMKRSQRHHRGSRRGLVAAWCEVLPPGKAGAVRVGAGGGWSEKLKLGKQKWRYPGSRRTRSGLLLPLRRLALPGHNEVLFGIKIQQAPVLPANRVRETLPEVAATEEKLHLPNIRCQRLLNHKLFCGVLNGTRDSVTSFQNR